MTAAAASADTAGTVHFVRSADTAFNQYTSNPSPEQQAWLRAHIWRMTVWSPYFDSKTSWYGQGWIYKDAYAIYKGSQLASQHPEWILRSASGSNLYIPFGCSGGSCPQYAGDISNPAFRHYWIEEARAELAHGYRGLFVDDVNMEERVGNGEGQQVTPISPSSGQELTPDAWRKALGTFMAEVRAAFPTAEIAHNAIWFSDSDAGTAEPSIRQEIESANYIFLERGVNDSGLTGGTGPWSVNALLSFVDQVHALGRGVVLDGASGEPSGMEYNLASFFLISTGNDGVSGSGQTPSNWWSGWNVNLGEAKGSRYSWSSVLRRDFTGGMALVNPPGSPARTVTLPTPMQTTSGATVATVTLAAASGVVLTGTTTTAPAPSGSTPEVPTQTTVESTPVAPTEGAGSAGSGPGSAGTGSSGAGSAGTGSTGAGASHSPPRGAPSRGSERRHAQRVRRRLRAHRASRASIARRSHGRAALERVSGLVLHASQGRVSIELDRWAAGHWVYVRRMTVAVGGDGRFARLLTLHTALRYRVRASYMGAPLYRPSRSRYRFVMLHGA